MTSITVLEHVTRVTPLGVRFRDGATSTYVSWGLVAELFPDGQPERLFTGVVNRSDVFCFQSLPSMRDVEFGAGDAAYWAAETPRFPFVLQVRDTERRFLPYSLDVLLPVRRLLGITINSPLTSPLTGQTSSSTASLPLFSAPSRTVPDGMAAIRAEIVDVVNNEPAAWAVVEAQGPGQAMSMGVADELGRVLVPLPYPNPIITLGSPGSPPLPLTAQGWSIGITVRYRRRTPVPSVPDLGELLTQPVATAWLDTAATIPLTQTTLPFGRDAVVASLTGTGDPSPTLLITPS